MRQIWFAIGVLCLALGIVGMALPILPTVPFLLAASWAFAKSSPRLQQKILEHPTYGPPVRAWQERGAISRLAKIWAVTAMTGGVVLALWLAVPLWVVAGQSLICGLVAIYLLTRPEE